MLKPHVNDEIFAIGRDALCNAQRYAQAHRVLLELDYGDDAFTLRVRDDGRGLDPLVAKSGYRPGHWGLPGMRERAESIGASFHLASEPGRGTKIVVTLSGELAYQFCTAHAAAAKAQARLRMRPIACATPWP
jgi:signal transduction histidine kinase